jgi:hypothetical protein
MKAPPTHRALPEDAALVGLPDEVRAGVAATWRSRARNELSTSTVFASLTRSLVRIGAPHAIVRQAAVAVADEVRHAEICEYVAEAYWPHGRGPERSPVVAEPLLAHGEVHEVEAAAYLIMQSCLNEGIACVYLQQCLSEARFELARAAVRDILEDEIEHARMGWSFLASSAMPSSWRSGVAGALPDLLERVARAWTAHDSAAPVSPMGHGNLAASAMPGVVRSACEDLILPGFDHVGIDTRPARAWFASLSSG